MGSNAFRDRDSMRNLVNISPKGLFGSLSSLPQAINYLTINEMKFSGRILAKAGGMQMRIGGWEWGREPFRRS